MDLLLIDCNSVRTDEQQKASELSKCDDLRVSLLVPSYYIENYKKNKIQKTFDPGYKISVGSLVGKHPNRAIFTNKLLKEILKKPDIICVHSDENFFLTFQVLLFKMLFSPKSKFIFHTWQNICFNSNSFPQHNKILYYIDNLIEKFVLKFSDACITRNKEALTIMKKKGFKGFLTYIPWGTNIDNFYKKDAANIKKEYGLDGFIIGYIGRLVEEKGILDLLNAAKNIKDEYTLLLIGNGPLKKTIIDSAERLGILKHVKLLDGIPFKDVPSMMNCLDTLILPSRTSKKWKEQFGRVLIEAMACEVPVIGSDSGAIADVIGDAGLIFKEADITDMAEKIITLIKDRPLMDRLRKKTRQRVLENFTWQIFAKKSHVFFKEILHTKEEAAE